MRLLISAGLGLSLISGAALAQSVGGTGSGMDSNARSMSGPNINVDNGINANGTPKQQSPGVSMTNGPAVNGASGTLDGDGTPHTGGAASTNNAMTHTTMGNTATGGSAQ
jgi:hypothetical protein